MKTVRGEEDRLVCGRSSIAACHDLLRTSNDARLGARPNGLHFSPSISVSISISISLSLAVSLSLEAAAFDGSSACSRRWRESPWPECLCGVLIHKYTDDYKSIRILLPIIQDMMMKRLEGDMIIL